MIVCIFQLLADRTYASVASVVVYNVCIVTKRCVLEQKLLTAYRKSYVRNRLVQK